MKALTLHAPWAFAVAHLGKRVENRTWQPPESLIGQRIAIHAGGPVNWRRAMWCNVFSAARVAGLSIEEIQTKMRGVNVHTGGGFDYCFRVVCTARVAGIVPPDEDLPWHVIGQYGWLLDDVQLVSSPVMSGRLGLWDVDLGGVP